MMWYILCMQISYRIVIPTGKFKNKQGEDKTRWNEVGRLVAFEKDGKPDGFILELSMFPSLDFKLFPIEPKPARVEAGEATMPASDSKGLNTDKLLRSRA